MSDVLPRPGAFEDLVARAVWELERSGRLVTYQSLADFMGVSVYLLRKVVSMPLEDMAAREERLP